MADPVDMFNRKLQDFLADLQPLLGHLPEYNLVSSSSKWLTQFDPRQNYQLFDRHVAAPFGDRIKAMDEEFFMSDKIQVGIPSSNEGGPNDGGFGVVQLIRSVWSSRMSKQDREAVWAHLRVLVVLSERCKAARMSKLDS